MLLPVNINVNFVNNILTFIVIVYLEAAIQEFSLKQPFISGILEEFPRGLIPSRTAGCMSAVLVEVSSFMDGSRVFC